MQIKDALVDTDRATTYIVLLMFISVKKVVRICSIVLFLTLVARTFASAQETGPNLSIEFLSNQQVSNVNFEQASFEVHAESVVKTLEAYFSDFEKAHEIVVLETFSTDSVPQYSIHAHPAMFLDDMEKLVQSLSKIKGVQALFADFHLAYIIETKGGIQGKGTAYVPEFMVPAQLEFEALQVLTLRQMRKKIQKWARTEVLPILGAFEQQVPEKFKGVITVGIMTSTTDLSVLQDVLLITDRNADYWRGIMEMSPGNMMVVASKIFMHVANGEFDYVDKYLETLVYFTDPNTIAAHYFKELRWRLAMFNDELAAQVNGGIMMYDAKKYIKSAEVYERILREYPGSAWAVWELYCSNNALKIQHGEIVADDRSDWHVFRDRMFKANPFYGADNVALTATEAYLNFRRAEMAQLFVREKEVIEDFITLADISLDLGNFGFSAHLYWVLISSTPKSEHEDRELTPYFLYCLEKLDQKEIIEYFQGEQDIEFTYIGEERKQLMLESTSYQKFKDAD